MLVSETTAASRAGLLADFQFGKSIFPSLALGMVALLFWAYGNWGQGLIVLLKLCLAYAVPYYVLSAFARLWRKEADLRTIMIISVPAILSGGVAACLLALGWNPVLWSNWRIVGFEVLQACAFAAFFIVTSLVSSSMARQTKMVADTQRQMLEARLAALQAQVEPHFLMNTLANLRHLLRADAQRALQMLDHLSEFLQGSLQQSRNSHTSLGKELHAARHYLEIMRIRFGDRLQLKLDVNDDLLEQQIPSFLLQILVENAVVHGIEPSDEGGCITIQACLRDNFLIVGVIDSGVGLNSAKPATGNGVGLRIIRERLATLYGMRAGLSLQANEPQGTVVTLSIPLV
ncbi:MAG: histidine kinase [Pseudomonadota bacterium]